MEHDTPSSGFTVDASSTPARTRVALTRPFVPTRTARRDRPTVTPFTVVVVVDAIARTTATTITVVVSPRARDSLDRVDPIATRTDSALDDG